MTRQEAVGSMVALVKSVGLPIYRAPTRREPTRPGVAVRLGWRRQGTLDLLVEGGVHTDWFNQLRELLRRSGWEEIYLNEPGQAVSVRRARPKVNPATSASFFAFLPPDVRHALVPEVRPLRQHTHYLLRYAEGPTEVNGLLAGQVVDTLAGLQRILKAVALVAPPRASKRYLKVSFTPFQGAPPNPQAAEGSRRLDLQHEDAEDLYLADPQSPHFVPAESWEQNQPATAHDLALAERVHQVVAVGEDKPPGLSGTAAAAPIPSWESPVFGSVYVKPGDWTNLGAVVDGKRMRYGWSLEQSRWARGEVPPTALLAEAQVHGWSFWLAGGQGAAATAPAAAAAAPTPRRVPASAPAPAPAPKPIKVEKPAFTDVLVPWEELRAGDIIIRWDERSGLTWVQTINPELRNIGIGKQLKLNAKELLNSSASGRDNRVVSGNGKHIPANDFTYANIVHRRGVSDQATHKYNLIPGWGATLIRFYLDELGVTYNRDARFLRWSGGSSDARFYDITTDPSVVYPGASLRPKAGDVELKPRPDDVTLERNGSRFYIRLHGAGYRTSEEFSRKLTAAESVPRNGERVWDPYNMTMAVDKLAVVPAPDFTEGNIRAYGRRLVNKYQRWMYDVAQRLLGLSLEQIGELADLPHWRMDDYENRAIHEHLSWVPAAIEDSARVLYRSGPTQHWEDVTEGTERGNLASVRLPPTHPLFQAVREEARPFDPAAYAEKFRTLADNMDKTIESKMDSAIGRQRVTDRRARIASGMYEEGLSLQRVQGILHALADAAEAGTLPESLRQVRSRADVEMLAYPWRRLIKDIEHDEQYNHKDRAEARRHILAQGRIGDYEGAKLPGHWTQWKGERAEVLKKAPRKAPSRVFLKWADSLYHEQSATPPPAVAEAIVELGGDVFNPLAVELAQKVRRAYRLGASTDRQWHQLLLDFRPFWEAGRKERRSAAEVKKKQRRDAERELIGINIQGFFPTPPALARRVVQEAHIQPGDRVLEPSAGKGDLALAVQEAHPDVHIDVVERSSSLRAVLETLGFHLVAFDFMEYNPGPVYNRIVMNPPFENGQDAEHVMRAYEMLKPGGRLAAIMSAGPFFRSLKRDQAFRDWLEAIGGQVEDLPEGSFTGAESFRQTGVNTKLIVIERAG